MRIWTFHALDALLYQEWHARLHRALAENQEPGTRNQEPGTRNREPGTENQEPGTENREPGTENQEPGTENQELRTDFFQTGDEQRAWYCTKR